MCKQSKQVELLFFPPLFWLTKCLSNILVDQFDLLIISLEKRAFLCWCKVCSKFRIAALCNHILYCWENLCINYGILLKNGILLSLKLYIFVLYWIASSPATTRAIFRRVLWVCQQMVGNVSHTLPYDSYEW